MLEVFFKVIVHDLYLLWVFSILQNILVALLLWSNQELLEHLWLFRFIFLFLLLLNWFSIFINVSVFENIFISCQDLLWSHSPSFELKLAVLTDVFYLVFLFLSIQFGYQIVETCLWILELLTVQDNLCWFFILWSKKWPWLAFFTFAVDDRMVWFIWVPDVTITILHHRISFSQHLCLFFCFTNKCASSFIWWIVAMSIKHIFFAMMNIVFRIIDIYKCIGHALNLFHPPEIMCYSNTCCFTVLFLIFISICFRKLLILGIAATF